VTGYRSVIFDCDSTLCGIEGIDELAGPRRDEVRAMTELAMDGSVPLEEVYGRRLELIAPTRAKVDALGAEYVRRLVDDAGDTVRELLRLGIAVRIVSGGLMPAVLAVALKLGLQSEHVAAVDIRFDEGGRYAGFDDASPLTRTGGKEIMIGRWDLPRPSLLVGDGATDLEARPAVDAFAAFMGFADRPAVAERADFVIRERSLAPVLALARGHQ
jgi:phosphoserine phosphatase